MTGRGSMMTEAFVYWLQHFSCYKIAGTCLWVFDGATSHLDHITVELQTAMLLLCCAFQVRLPINCNLWTNLSLDHLSITRMKRLCCFITTAQIALSPSRSLARFSLKQGTKQPQRATGMYPFNPSIISDIGSQSCNAQ